MKGQYLLILGIALTLLVGACSTGTPTPTSAPDEVTEPTAVPTEEKVMDEDAIYLNLVWHQHQPLYYKDENGTYTRPWARAHATKDYYDMAALLQDYPGVHVTFNLTPVLIRQLDDLASGAKDYYRVLAEIPAGDLTDDQKRFILTRFFDANWDHVITRIPRYVELLDKRGRSLDTETIEAALNSFTDQDFRDLQVWWNLVWFDPSFLVEEPLLSLIQKGKDFDGGDKDILFQMVDAIVTSVVPLHKDMQDSGQIEVIITPYAHPILPLLFTTDLAVFGDPLAELPERFSYPDDVVAQVQKSVEVYESHYGRSPRGMWPAEGAVAQEIVSYVAEAGFTWMATGEHVLAKSLGLDGFTRDSNEIVQESDALYRPYYVQARDGSKVAVVFRDLRISDLIGFEYSGDPGEEASQDFIDRIEAIRAQLKEEGAEGPHLVSVILDGENAWENYNNDGIDFLSALYRKLQESSTIQTITPSEYLELYPEQREIEELWPGAWFSSDYGTWIGEQEENVGWEYLRQTREVLADYDLKKTKDTSPENLAAALDFMYLAEGSDWFWWYGRDQDSGTDEYFDEAFRALLLGVFESLGEPVPDFVKVPIIAGQASPPTQTVQDLITVEVDGQVSEAEWGAAGHHEIRGGAQARAGDVLSALYYGYDPNNFYLRVDAEQPWAELGEGVLGIYLGLTGVSPTMGYSRLGGTDSLLGYGASALIEVHLDTDEATRVTISSPNPAGGWRAPAGSELLLFAEGDDVLEFGVPFDVLGDPLPGDQVNLRVIWSEGSTTDGHDVQLVPSEGPAQVILPELSIIDYFLVVDDPPGDDFGPGTYTYPTDLVFEPDVFDIMAFSAGVEGADFVFRFDLNGPINNHWGSGINLSIQTFDIYIDIDPGASTGARLLLDGRNAALASDSGWDMAVWIEGWNQKVFLPDEEGNPQEVSGSNVKVVVNPSGSISIRVSGAALPQLGANESGEWTMDPTTFGYAAMVLSQDGFPSAGVMRVRDVESEASQWRIGGGPEDTNHTRIIDLVFDGDQAGVLGTYTASQESVGKLTPDDFAQVLLLLVD